MERTTSNSTKVIDTYNKEINKIRETDVSVTSAIEGPGMVATSTVPATLTTVTSSSSTRLLMMDELFMKEMQHQQLQIPRNHTQKQSQQRTLLPHGKQPGKCDQLLADDPRTMQLAMELSMMDLTDTSYNNVSRSRQAGTLMRAGVALAGSAIIANDASLLRGKRQHQQMHMHQQLEQLKHLHQLELNVPGAFDVSLLSTASTAHTPSLLLTKRADKKSMATNNYMLHGDEEISPAEVIAMQHQHIFAEELQLASSSLLRTLNPNSNVSAATGTTGSSSQAVLTSPLHSSSIADSLMILQSSAQPSTHDERSKKSQNMTECVPVPSSEHVAEIVGRQGCKIKALRAKTNTYIKTPVRGDEPVFIITGRKEDVAKAQREILSAADHFSLIRATRRSSCEHITGSVTVGSVVNDSVLPSSVYKSSEASASTIGPTTSTAVGPRGTISFHGINSCDNGHNSPHSSNILSEMSKCSIVALSCSDKVGGGSISGANSAGSRSATQGLPNIPGQVTIQVRVPYRVVGLVVGTKGATIKHIQQETQTYIVTPSREKEPIFEVTGLPDNVQTARRKIESHIAIRTGNLSAAMNAVVTSVACSNGVASLRSVSANESGHMFNVSCYDGALPDNSETMVAACNDVPTVIEQSQLSDCSSPMNNITTLTQILTEELNMDFLTSLYKNGFCAAAFDCSGGQQNPVSGRSSVLHGAFSNVSSDRTVLRKSHTGQSVSSMCSFAESLPLCVEECLETIDATQSHKPKATNLEFRHDISAGENCFNLDRCVLSSPHNTHTYAFDLPLLPLPGSCNVHADGGSTVNDICTMSAASDTISAINNVALACFNQTVNMQAMTRSCSSASSTSSTKSARNSGDSSGNSSSSSRPELQNIWRNLGDSLDVDEGIGDSPSVWQLNNVMGPLNANINSVASENSCAKSAMLSGTANEGIKSNSGVLFSAAAMGVSSSASRPPIGTISAAAATLLAGDSVLSGSYSSSAVGNFGCSTASLAASPVDPLLDGVNGSMTVAASNAHCLMCHEREVSAVLVPCGHNMYCSDCANRICFSIKDGGTVKDQNGLSMTTDRVENVSASVPICPVCSLNVAQAIRIVA